MENHPTLWSRRIRRYLFRAIALKTPMRARRIARKTKLSVENPSSLPTIRELLPKTPAPISIEFIAQGTSLWARFFIGSRPSCITTLMTQQVHWNIGGNLFILKKNRHPFSTWWRKMSRLFRVQASHHFSDKVLGKSISCSHQSDKMWSNTGNY